MAQDEKKGAVKKVVLAYSGGLDTSIILKWLQTTYGCEVVTFTADLGQGEELEPARAKALMLGVNAITALNEPLPSGRGAVPPLAPALLLVLAVVFFGFAGVVFPLRLRSPSRMERWVDRRWGARTYESFILRLRPLLFFAASGVPMLAVWTWRAGSLGPLLGAEPDLSFLLGGPLGFLVLHAILRLRRAPLVFPSWKRGPFAVLPEPLALGPALKRYGWTLVPLALFVPAMAALSQLGTRGDGASVVGFIAVTLTAMWPVFSQRARPSFWLAAMGVWGGGLVVLVLLSMAGLTGR